METSITAAVVGDGVVGIDVEKMFRVRESGWDSFREPRKSEPRGGRCEFAEPGPGLRSRSRNFVVHLRGEIFFVEEAPITLSIERDKGSFGKEERPSRGQRLRSSTMPDGARSNFSRPPRPEKAPGGRQRKGFSFRRAISSLSFPFLQSVRYLRDPFPPELAAGGTAPPE